MSRELREVTCRSCRTQLGIDDSGDANQRLAALFVMSITLGLHPGGASEAHVGSREPKRGSGPRLALGK